MISIRGLVMALVVLASSTGAAVVPADAQSPAAPRRVGEGQGRAGRGASIAEVERIIDRYMLGRARIVLRLSPDQMVDFAQRFERLQVLQRTRQRQRQRRLLELNALTRNNAAPADEATVGRALEALDTELADADRQVREARAALDEVLTVRQRARYRTLEVAMERERLQLVARARAEARGRAGAAADADRDPPDAGRTP